MRALSTRVLPAVALAAVLGGAFGVPAGSSALASAQLRQVMAAGASGAHVNLNGQLTAVATSSANSAWAVGLPSLVLHWNGKIWSTVAVPARDSALLGVAAVSAKDAWTVGRRGSRQLIWHWNGRVWSQVRSPALRAGSLGGVAAVSATDVWAVGGGSILHWNGKVWSASPHPGGSVGAVTAISARDVWAVGDQCVNQGCAFSVPVALHWNGRAWSKIKIPSPGAFGNSLRSVTATSASNVWAAGSHCINADCNPLRTLIMHWNGKTWARVKSPSPAIASDLNGVSATSAANIWAVGGYCVRQPCGIKVIHTLVLHWNGRTWARVKGWNPNPAAFNSLTGVTAASTSRTWAVGQHCSRCVGPRTLVLRWNGTAWVRV